MTINALEAAAKAMWDERERQAIPDEGMRRRWEALEKLAPTLRAQWLDAVAAGIKAYRKAGGT